MTSVKLFHNSAGSKEMQPRLARDVYRQWLVRQVEGPAQSEEQVRYLADGSRHIRGNQFKYSPFSAVLVSVYYFTAQVYLGRSVCRQIMVTMLPQFSQGLSVSTVARQCHAASNTSHKKSHTSRQALSVLLVKVRKTTVMLSKDFRHIPILSVPR